VIDSAGAVKNSYTYKPYGQFYDGEAVETVDNPWKFTGQYYDKEIEQYYLRARQYDPAMMRFTSRDPVRGDREDPLTLHRYLYCLNDPVDYVDPSGRSVFDDLNAIKEGAAIHNEAIASTCYGIAYNNDKFLTLGILMQQMVAPAMEIARIIDVRINQLEAARNALDSIARQVERLGITSEEAQIMMDWADEYNVPRSKGFERHLGRNYDKWHIRIGSHDHITIKDYCP